MQANVTVVIPAGHGKKGDSVYPTLYVDALTCIQALFLLVLATTSMYQ